MRKLFLFFAAILSLASIFAAVTSSAAIFSFSSAEGAAEILGLKIDEGLITKIKEHFDKEPAASGGEEVYLGGVPVGVELFGDGVKIIKILDVITSKGAISPLAGKNIEAGDVITHVNGHIVRSVGEVKERLLGSAGQVTLSVKRGDTSFTVSVTPAIDAATGLRKLGIELENNTSGIGTLTFIRKNGRFGALGHKIAAEGKPARGHGNIYFARINSIRRGEKGCAGALLGNYPVKRKIGAIDKNGPFGIYGDWNNPPLKTTVSVGSRDKVTTGAAQIYTTVKGGRPELYDIEIIKASEQSAPEEKGLMIVITDKRLIEATGGIVQGMSGSPILQNGLLVGAVTHVLTGEPTKGYGVYIDWMLLESTAAYGNGEIEIAA
jgi:stage IV sporulation protein B